jgi:SAM-dependent methyltransferase
MNAYRKSRLMRCPVCVSWLLVPLRLLVGQRTRRRFLLRACLACGSLYNRSDYHENDEGLRNDAQYLADNLEHHSRSMQTLVTALIDRCPGARRLLDIGAGAGSLVQVATALGLQAEGVELNPHAVAWSRSHLGLTLHCSRFERGSFGEPFDIVTCNQVLEHLEAPRALFSDAVAAVRPGGLLFISVPFRPTALRDVIRYVIRPGLAGSPFFDNDAHILHFSRRGMLRMALDFGLTDAQWLEHDLQGYVFRR